MCVKSNKVFCCFWLNIYIYIITVFQFQNTSGYPLQKLRDSNKILWILVYLTFVFQLYKLHFLEMGSEVTHGEQATIWRGAEFIL